MVWHLQSAPRNWWLRRTGREAEAQRFIERLAMNWSRGILSQLRCRVDVEGLEHVPATGAVVVMSNHQGLYDIPVLIAHLGRVMGFVAKYQLFRIPVLSYWMRQIHCVSLRREDARDSARIYEELSTTLAAEQRGFILFPEGTRSRNPEGDMGPFRRGALRMVLHKAIPVLPVAIDGSRLFTQPDAMQSTRLGGRVIRVKVLPLRQVKSDWSAPERKAFMENLQADLVRERDAIKVHWPEGGRSASVPDGAAGTDPASDEERP